MDIRQQFPAKPTSVRAARYFVAGALGDRDVDSTVAVLLTSELATNVLQHVGSTFLVRVCETRRGIRVEVADGSTEVPLAKRDGVSEPAGRGLAMVQALASEWGVDRTSRGKVVWFELR